VGRHNYLTQEKRDLFKPYNGYFSRKLSGHHVHELAYGISDQGTKEDHWRAPNSATAGSSLIAVSNTALISINSCTSNTASRAPTDGYDCYQNALAERVNRILKMEFLLHHKDLAEARGWLTSRC
jgi:putative transposase